MVAADQIHPPPDREELKKEKEKDDSNKSDNSVFKSSGLDHEALPKIKESSVKPTNQRVHPTVSLEHRKYLFIYLFIR